MTTKMGKHKTTPSVRNPVLFFEIFLKKFRAASWRNFETSLKILIAEQKHCNVFKNRDFEMEWTGFPETANCRTLVLFDGKATSAEASQKTDVEKQPRDAPLAATDGGWGWCIVLVAFYMNLTVCGISYSSGVYFPVLLEEFGQSTSKTAWVGSLSNGCVMIVCK